jgi:hypothetical protein
VASQGHVCWLYDDRFGSVPRSLRPLWHYRFSLEQVTRRYEATLRGKKTLSGRTQLPLLSFFHDHPQYRYYWLIEYDVRFSGDWGRFFREFLDDPADFITCHIRHYSEEPDWPSWALDHPQKEIPLASRLRSFNPIYRISHAALLFLDGALQDGWCGHQETLIPTLLHHQGLRLADLGGNGPFSPAWRRHRLYVDSCPNPRGVLQTGTMRFRPSFWRPGPGKGLLYHPVKPLLTVLREYHHNVRDRVRRLRPTRRRASDG